MSRSSEKTKAFSGAVNGQELELLALNAAFEAARAGEAGARMASLAHELKLKAKKMAAQKTAEKERAQ